ncbi:hypothetical protein EV122DRAFT_277987 [Schizophyllum commune]|nr:hypothetical protein K525DRAFT_263501 [Schizophyllum commune Loenen D]
MQRNQQQQSRAPPLSYSVQVGDSTSGGVQFYPVGNVSGAASSSNLSDQRRRGVPQSARAGHPHLSADFRSGSEDRNIGASVYLYHSKRNCVQGENCRFHHYPELPASSSRTQLSVIVEQASAPAHESSSGSLERRPSHGEHGAAGDAKREVRLARIVQDDAAHTFKKSVSGCIVTFGAGAAIQYLVDGSHISTVKVTGLPTRSTPQSVSLLIDRRGIPPESFWVSSHDTYNNVCEVLVECRYAKELVAALNGADMDDSRLRATVVDAGGVTCNPSYVLSIWWRAPSVSYVATYRSTASAESRARALNGQPMRDRRVHAIVQNVRNANLDVLPSTAVIVNGLPVSVTDGEFPRFAGTNDVDRQPFGDYDIDRTISFL